MTKPITVLMILLLLTGCGAQWAYNNVDWFVVRYVDNYVELNGDQRELLGEKVSDFLRWHRESELPRYIAHLDEFMLVEPSQVNMAYLLDQQRRFREHGNRLLIKLQPEIHQLAAQLSDEQVEALLVKIETNRNKRRAQHQPADANQVQENQANEKKEEDLLRKRYSERISDGLEMWLGSITPAQQVKVDYWAASIVSTREEWLAHQALFQRKLEQLLAHRHDEGRFVEVYRQLAFQPDTLYSKSFQQKRQHNIQLANQSMLNLIQVASDQQVTHFRGEVQSWREIAQDLSP
ncbi:DUF6279 family lipoprotein [Vibrio profundum]|uniref:DUF6279 family lipoprotein n=1 Tax=Vibrio profundum TaxID=2910247 RepID=UPI003D14F2F2